MVDLTKCKPGDKLRSKHGLVLTYVGRNTGDYPHTVQYPDGSGGTRTDDGFTYRTKRMETDHDIIEVIPDAQV